MLEKLEDLRYFKTIGRIGADTYEIDEDIKSIKEELGRGSKVNEKFYLVVSPKDAKKEFYQVVHSVFPNLKNGGGGVIRDDFENKEDAVSWADNMAAEDDGETEVTVDDTPFSEHYDNWLKANKGEKVDDVNSDDTDIDPEESDEVKDTITKKEVMGKYNLTDEAINELGNNTWASISAAMELGDWEKIEELLGKGEVAVESKIPDVSKDSIKDQIKKLLEDETKEIEVKEKKVAPKCSKCGKKHFPFQKCSKGKKVKEGKVNEMKTEIVNTVDYDYPTCGGIIVTRGRTHYTITIESNYSGNRTGVKYTMPVTPVRDEWTEEDWVEVVETIDNYNARRISRGILVQ
jgi:hypothetical protein